MPNRCENYLEVRGPGGDLRRLGSILDADALEAGLETLDGQVQEYDGAFTVAFPTRWGPQLGAMAALAECFPSLRFALLYFEFYLGLRGYAEFGPGHARRMGHEEYLDLNSEPRLFPAHYPAPLGSEGWAAAARSDFPPSDESE